VTVAAYLSRRRILFSGDFASVDDMIRTRAIVEASKVLSLPNPFYRLIFKTRKERS
jgi:hypothetical protein